MFRRVRLQCGLCTVGVMISVRDIDSGDGYDGVWIKVLFSKFEQKKAVAFAMSFSKMSSVNDQEPQK